MNETPPTNLPANAPVPSEILEPSDYSQYLLHGRSEILNVLRSLVDHGSQITIFFNSGKDLLLTTLISVDEKRGLIFDYGSTEAINAKAIKSDKLFCVASVDKVKVQFIIRRLGFSEDQGQPALQADFPENLLRLQRREYYRLTMPITRPLVCHVPVSTGLGNSQVLAFNVVDISGGGVALAFTPGGPSLIEGEDYPNCIIDLPEIGRVTASVNVRSIFELTLRNGSVLWRAGCQFVKLAGPHLTLIQRYIIKIERERKARETGLA